MSTAQILSPWENGFLDIHHINTGRGDATFCILPDGTTLLIDAGGSSKDCKRVVKRKPNSSKSPGKWITDYIKGVIPNNKKDIDYFFLTHFHDDHINGIYEVYSYFPCKKWIDRGTSYTTVLNKSKTYKYYKDFLQNHLKEFNYESFNVGSKTQFTLLHNPQEYNSSFEIRNIYSHGMLWDGEKSCNSLYPKNIEMKGKDSPKENMHSCVIKIKYGHFDYYTGGDIPGFHRPGRPLWHDIETPVAKKIGPVEVAVANHHGNGDATNENFLTQLAPRNIIISTWDALHPEHKVLSRMLSQELYPGKRDLFLTNIHPAAEVVIGKILKKVKSKQGHIVIRVFPKGNTYSIYILDDGNEKHKIKAMFGPYNCKK